MSLRIVTLDYYMAPPIPELDYCYSSLLGQPIAEVPIVRIFGTTLTGRKICLHLHKAFPYFYVPYDKDLPQDESHAWMFVRSLALAIEKALKLASNSGAKQQHVYSCSLVRGKKFYGFHAEEQLFVKIVLYHPQDVSRLSGILLGGGILNKQFQPYESHIPFLLQVLVDHNLAGMGHLHLSNIQFRQPVLENQFSHIRASKSDLKNVVSSLVESITSMGSSTMEARVLICKLMEVWCRRVHSEVNTQFTLPDKQSTCELEGDTCVEAILNQYELCYTPLEKASSGVKMVQSLVPMWDELNIAVSTGSVGKERTVQSQNDGVDAAYKERFSKIIQNSIEVKDQSSRDIGAENVRGELNGGDESIRKCNTLLLSTQAAYSRGSPSSKQSHSCESVSLGIGFGATDERHDDLLNEDLIKQKFTQDSQDTDEEAIEILKWMTSLEQDDVSGGRLSDFEGLHDEMSLSEAFQHADAALAKVLADYEVSSQQECQEILDCTQYTENGPSGALRSSNDCIPQLDGSFDEDEPDLEASKRESERKFFSKSRESGNSVMDEHADKAVKKWGLVPVKRTSELVLACEARHVARSLNEGTSRSVRDPKCPGMANLGSSELSARDLMRSKRMRRQLTQTTAANCLSESIDARDVENKLILIKDGGQEIEQSARFGPLPFLKSDLPGNRYQGEGIIKEELQLESCQSVNAEIHTANGGACSGMELWFPEKTEALTKNISCEVRYGGLAVTGKGTEESQSFACAELHRDPDMLNESRSAGDVMESKSHLVNFCFWRKPPTAEHLLATFQNYDLPSANHGEVFYGNPEDLPDQPTVMAGLLFKAKSKGVDHLSCFEFGSNGGGRCQLSNFTSVNMWSPFTENDTTILPSHFQNDGTALFLLSPVKLPPRIVDVCTWLRGRNFQESNVHKYEDDIHDVCTQHSDGTEHDDEISKPASPKYNESFAFLSPKELITTIDQKSMSQCSLQTDVGTISDRKCILSSDISRDCSSSKGVQYGSSAEEHRSRGDVSQISGPSGAVHNITPLSQTGFKDPASIGHGQQISIMSIEVLALNRGDLRPDPRYDAIECITLTIQNDANTGQLSWSSTFVLLHNDQDGESTRNYNGLIGCEVFKAKDEISLLQMFIWFVRMCDPDILVGWEIQGFSLGILAERAANLGLGLLREISRIPTNKELSQALANSAGKEVKINPSETVMEQLVIDDEWGRTHGSGIHVDGRIVLNLWRIMRSEVKLGIYTVEAVSEAVLKRKVPQIPWRTLTQWFTNRCGKNKHLCLEYCIRRAQLNLEIMDQLDLVNRTSELARVFGIDFFSVLSRGSQYRVESMLLRIAHSQNFLLLSPSREQIRPGVLPRLLDEILSTRIMIKQSMKKLLPTQKVLERVLNARQLALKLISNVTYGYTAAGFSGRMPCAEIADSIVQCGRKTLESAINFVNTNAKWNAQVVYGDTDSMFVLLKGRTKSEAFEIGEEIADAITELNPHPVTLKMEKVYHPCVLMTKKRYVGYSYENINQETPKFDAKGIETVRRDSCAAVSKTLEKSLRILFESHDVSQVKAYLQRQWRKIISGRISFQDFIFAKEVRLGSYSARASVLPPAAIVATKAMALDPRAEPRYGERIPYIVVHGELGARLVDMVVDPHALVHPSSELRLHDVYYITKQIIPALQRVFGLIGVDLNAWYNDLPRVSRPSFTKRSVPRCLLKVSYDNYETDNGLTRTLVNSHTIDHYYLSQHCLVCGDLVPAASSTCGNCSTSRDLVGTIVLGRLSFLERQFKHLIEICRHCGGGNEADLEEGLGCVSPACLVYYERNKIQRERKAAIIAAEQSGLLQLQYLH
ncbi:hypothetical protein KP509_06G067000 [Ceratopteris richardii]|uniref:DNA polymerase n=1 Tax=Ceratopteris richardii TaxID=49495 RepID=A0A8T2UHA4_CERRI|nr:hypothetical protein KP509_06G067000 [Ceratopteris richardii]